MATCDESISIVLAPIRLAMKRSAAAGMALSCFATKYHEGIVFQAGTPDGSPSVITEPGRWVAAMTAASPAGRSAQKTWWNTVGLM
jgi:hypothetical protein